jgi:hypothetical protein
MRDPSYYRAMAEDCVLLAQRAALPRYRHQLLNIAYAWLWLARCTEIATNPGHEISTVRSKDAVTLGDDPWTHLPPI